MFDKKFNTEIKSTRLNERLITSIKEVFLLSKSRAWILDHENDSISLLYFLDERETNLLRILLSKLAKEKTENGYRIFEI